VQELFSPDPLALTHEGFARLSTCPLGYLCDAERIVIIKAETLKTNARAKELFLRSPQPA